MNTNPLLQIMLTVLVCSCAMSTESTVQAASVRVCTYLSGASNGLVYITPEDNRSQCIVLQTSGGSAAGASLKANPCAELGWSRDEARTEETGTPVPGVVATVEGGFDGEDGITYDFRVTLAGPDGVRVVHAVGTSPDRAWESARECYRPASSPP